MDGIYQQISNILTTPPGSLAFSLVLLFCVSSSLSGALLHRKDIPSPQNMRFFIGITLLLVSQLAYLGAAVASWQIPSFTHSILPPLDRCLTLLSILLVVWLWVFPFPTRVADIVCAIFLVLIPILAMANYWFWINQPVDGPFNATLFDLIWNILISLTLLIAIILLIKRKPPAWIAGLCFMGINLLGIVYHFVIGTSSADLAASVRLAWLITFPFIPLLAQRIQMKPVPPEEEWIPEPAFEPIDEYPSFVPEPEIMVENASLMNQLEVSNRALAEANASLTQLKAENEKFKNVPPPVVPPVAPSLNPAEVSSLANTLSIPLFNIIANANLIKTDTVGVLGVLQRNFLSEIIDISDKTNTLVSRLAAEPLKIKEIESGFNKTDPISCVDSAIATMNNAIREKNIALRLDIPENLPHLGMSANVLEQIIIQLMQNAVQVSPAESTVSIGVDEVQDDQDRAGLLFQMADYGGPISVKNLEKIFLANQSSSAEPKYRGIGSLSALRLAKSMVEMYGGKIWLESKNKQTTYYFQIPI